MNLQISKIIFSHSFYFNYYIFTFSELKSAWIALILVQSCSAKFSGCKTGGALFFFDKSVFLNHSIPQFIPITLLPPFPPCRTCAVVPRGRHVPGGRRGPGGQEEAQAQDHLHGGSAGGEREGDEVFILIDS